MHAYVAVSGMAWDERDEVGLEWRDEVGEMGLARVRDKGGLAQISFFMFFVKMVGSLGEQKSDFHCVTLQTFKILPHTASGVRAFK